MEAAGKHTAAFWEAISSVYQATIEHPFVLQLASGELKKERFAHYLAQDILYIQDDNKALDLTALKAINPEERSFFQALAKDGLDIERALHDEYLDHFRVDLVNEKSPAVEVYTNFLLQHSQHSDYAVAAAALLPCFWVYNNVGNHILSLAKPNNPYQKWIDTYQGDEYEEYTQRFIDIVERLATDADEQLLQQMQTAFVQSTQYELDFFEEAFRV